MHNFDNILRNQATHLGAEYLHLESVCSAQAFVRINHHYKVR